MIRPLNKGSFFVQSKGYIYEVNWTSKTVVYFIRTFRKTNNLTGNFTDLVKK